jgi:uncharacterized Zn finger protein (UPF0148 family)
MPSFDVEFEVFCATCGAGLCNVAEGRNSRNRSMPQVSIEACSQCVENAKAPLQSEISDLHGQMAELEQQIESLKESNWNRLSDGEKDQAIRSAY